MFVIHGVPAYSEEFTEVETRVWFQLLVTLVEQLNRNLIQKHLALQ